MQQFRPSGKEHDHDHTGEHPQFCSRATQTGEDCPNSWQTFAALYKKSEIGANFTSVGEETQTVMNTRLLRERDVIPFQTLHLRAMQESPGTFGMTPEEFLQSSPAQMAQNCFQESKYEPKVTNRTAQFPLTAHHC